MKGGLQVGCSTGLSIQLRLGGLGGLGTRLGIHHMLGGIGTRPRLGGLSTHHRLGGSVL